jgi:hypothetical protein
MKNQPYLHKTEIRRAFEDAGYPVKGNAGITRMSGWSVDRAVKRRKRG